nr:MAG TPA: hypothetical protein [Caudoviricetes sp.]
MVMQKGLRIIGGLIFLCLRCSNENRLALRFVYKKIYIYRLQL